MVFWKSLPDEKSVKSKTFDSFGEVSDPPKVVPVPSVIEGVPNDAVNDSRACSPEEAINQRFGKIRSALGVGTVIQGKLTFDTPVRIDGKLSGEIFSSDAIIVGPQAIIDAKLEAAFLIVLGTVRGPVKVTKKVELYSGGTIESDIVTPSFSMEEGSIFNGRCGMPHLSKVVSVEVSQSHSLTNSQSKLPRETTVEPLSFSTDTESRVEESADSEDGQAEALPH